MFTPSSFIVEVVTSSPSVISGFSCCLHLSHERNLVAVRGDDEFAVDDVKEARQALSQGRFLLILQVSEEGTLGEPVRSAATRREGTGVKMHNWGFWFGGSGTEVEFY